MYVFDINNMFNPIQVCRPNHPLIDLFDWIFRRAQVKDVRTKIQEGIPTAQRPLRFSETIIQRSLIAHVFHSCIPHTEEDRYMYIYLTHLHRLHHSDRDWTCIQRHWYCSQHLYNHPHIYNTLLHCYKQSILLSYYKSYPHTAVNASLYLKHRLVMILGYINQSWDSLQV